MTRQIPFKFLDLFAKKSFAHLATLMPDGSPQVTPVWVDYDGENIIVNSSRGRQKDRNMVRDPRVAVSIQDPDNPYRYIQVRGTVVSITDADGVESINKLANRYIGKDYPWLSPGEIRVVYKIKPESVTYTG